VRGPYALQAAIAAVHCAAPSPQETDWTRIAALYDELQRLQPTPVVALNAAVAVAMAGDLDDGLRRIDDIAPALDGYHLLHAARADLLRRQHRFDESLTSYERALELATNDVERAYLQRRIDEVRAAAD
jgi:RNA polymerase sigma-70 factor (ECF subfamily)